MDTGVHVSMASDIESRAARIADPAIPLQTKCDVAAELREMVDQVRDGEGARLFPQMLSVLLDILRNGEPSLMKDSLEYKFRRFLIEIVHRIPMTEAIRPQCENLVNTLIHIVYNDSEENAVTCVKTMIDVLRQVKGLGDHHILSFIKLSMKLLANVPGVVAQHLDENSPPIPPNIALASMHSLKVLAEVPIAIVLFLQAYRNVVQASIPEVLPAAINIIVLQSSAQKKYREKKEAEHEYYVGMAPNLANPTLFSDLINAQIKMISFVAYLMKSQAETMKQDGRGDEVAVACVRLLQDCPVQQNPLRKELMVVLKHIQATHSRRALVPHIEKLLCERVLLGPSVGNQETIRPVAYSAISDLVHGVRSELTPRQILHIIQIYSCLIHSPHITIPVQSLCTKVMYGMLDAVMTRDMLKEAGENKVTIFESMLWTFVNKLNALVAQLDEFTGRVNANGKGEETSDTLTIEKERPVPSATHNAENPEDNLKELRFLFRGLMHGIRLCMAVLKKSDAPVSDGELLIQFFESCIRCMSLFDAKDAVAEKEALEWLGGILLEISPHIFQEMWTTRLQFFFEQVTKRPGLMLLAQLMFNADQTSAPLTAIVLRHFSDKLPELGEQDDQTAVCTIRLYKLAFGAVGVFPEANEPVLASHLGHLIMDSFPLAVKATHPTHYLHLLRALFRAIGSGAGRFELLYKEVLPLLPEMLDMLNRQLLAADSQTRDLLVELCLTVPLRLTHLLPHLHYLMQPLVAALKGGPELVSQGLRTIELCIDNLTGDFLDPILKPVLRDLMEALQSHLKPLPSNHFHAHTTIRILGKLGGRNRRLLDEVPRMDFKPYAEPAKAVMFFSGRKTDLELAPMASLASRVIRTPSPQRTYAYKFLENVLTVLMNEPDSARLEGRDRETVFVSGVEGLFDAIHISEVAESAELYLKTLSRHIFSLEASRALSKDVNNRRFPSHMFSLYLDALPHAMARADATEAEKAKRVVTEMIYDIVNIAHTNEISPYDLLPMLHQIATRFNALCFEESWVHKSAGCAGIMVMTSMPEVGDRWTTDREVDIVRTVLHVLKDTPHEPPKNMTEVVNILTHVIRVSYASFMQVDSGPQPANNKIQYLISVFFTELSTAHPFVRQAAQACIALLSELTGRSIVELLMPHRERILMSIYVKPLRALPFPLQIGQIEAIRYCVSLNPPLPELSDELLRLLHETLALADADDGTLISRANLRQSTIDATRLRVACIKLLTASLPLTDFYARQPQTRQRVTSVYFKSLYSSSQDVKIAAHEGLKAVLDHQARLPKDLLQTGLRPILMNLADPKRLSVPGLEGLARLLRLLTNYFRVEIGHKLLDHFRVIADPQMLRAACRAPLSDNEGITKLVRLANIYHLLPSAAHVFLQDLVNAIVTVETHLQSSTQSPFSEPLAKFLDRYPRESIDFFITQLFSPRHVRTFRNCIQGNLAPALLRELTGRIADITKFCFASGNEAEMLILPGLQLCSDLAELVPGWCTAYPNVINSIVALWKVHITQYINRPFVSSDVLQRFQIMLSIFTKALEESPRIDLLFEIITIYTKRIALDMSKTTRFLYNHVAFQGSLMFRRNVVTRFLVWFDDPNVPLPTKTQFLRYILTPMILIHAKRPEEKGALLDKEVLNRMQIRMWARMSDEAAFPDSDDLFRIELIHLATVMVHHCPENLTNVKREIIKSAFHLINSEDVIVKQTAYLLAARFFEAYDSPAKFILSAWTGLLKPPHTEGRSLVRQALDILAHVLHTRNPVDPKTPHWSKATRKLLSEEGHGNSQIIIIYQLIIRQPALFYAYRALFIPHMVNSLTKLGLNNTATLETRLLSLDILQVMFKWEQQAHSSAEQSPQSTTPLTYRENMVSYLVRLATGGFDQQGRGSLVPRTLALLKDMLAAPAWNDVSFKLDYFRKTLDQTEINEGTLPAACAAARVLTVICADKQDLWYTANVKVLQKLVQKGMASDDAVLQESLHPIVERLLKIYPLPKEDEEPQGEMAEFHNFVMNTIGEGLRNQTPLRGPLSMLKFVVQAMPERIEPFSVSLMKLLSKLAKEHITSSPQNQNYDNTLRLLLFIIEICQITVNFLGDQRKWLLSTLVVLVEKSSNPQLCRILLDIARDWALHRRDAYPTMKEKASLLQKMAAFEAKGDALFNQYLDLIYVIYTEPSLRRSDLTTRLEHPFLLGCRAKDTSLRERFMDLLDSSIPRNLTSRLSYVLGVQSWDAVADSNWIYLALDLLLSSVDGEEALSAVVNNPFPQRPNTLGSGRMKELVRPMRRLLYLDTNIAHATWVSVFSSVWSTLSRKEQGEITHLMVALLSREYHIRQCEMRPNVIQALLDGIHACSPPMSLPPHLVKYLAKTFGAWHVAMEILQNSTEQARDEDESIRENTYDSLAELYAELAEEDMFYGVWRRRSLHLETNVALAYEQNGMWQEAQVTYENAQNKARNQVITFTESEYCLWEDHWILAAEKLQQWDVLFELGRADNNIELMLEAAWRTKDWSDREIQSNLEQGISSLSDISTPRRRVFEAFTTLVKGTGTPERAAEFRTVEFTRILEDAMQLTLRKWIGLPGSMSAAHIPLLQNFQQFVELQEAVQIFGSLATTTAQNLEKKSSDLKLVLQAWRERLPNLHDDISVWSDLVAWRQNVFNAINKHYIPLIQNNQNGAPNASTFGYRGHHETAWIINRFAHVARKHDLLDVAQQSLKRIYELPNIEISEAFLKLREEARCHLQVPDELQVGLDLINNTNLIYFSTLQKSEFFTLKGLFYSRLGRNDEASHCFGQAVQMEMSLAKAWAEWGRFNDKMFKDNPTELQYANHAVSCYLQAAGIYKNGKSRPLLMRVLWLLSIDDNTYTISRAFDGYTGDAAMWYWITLIPQLCLSLSHREMKQARYILLNLARLHPQALFFPLRTTKEDMAFLKRQAAEAMAARGIAHTSPGQAQVHAQAQTQAAHPPGQSQSQAQQGTETPRIDAAPDVTMKEEESSTPLSQTHAGGADQSATTPQGTDVLSHFKPVKNAWEYVDEIGSILKTAYPLLTLTLETMVDQFNTRFRATPEEEIYRFTFMLLQEAMQNFSNRVHQVKDDLILHEATIKSIHRLAGNLAGPARKDYEETFINSKPLLPEYISRLQSWRDKYERFLDSRPRVQPLDLLSHWLTEFQYSKFDEVEVPGQYLENVDSNAQFSRISQFGSKFELCRGQGFCYKRLVIHGHDSTKHTFAVQMPAARWFRREERVMQLFRNFSSALSRRKESRKRNLHFHLPVAISVSPTLRLLASDPSSVTLQDIYDQHCDDMEISREEPILVAGDKIKATFSEASAHHKTEFVNLKRLVMDEVVTKLIPEDVLSKYMLRTMAGPSELWRIRKHFTVQLAAVCFMTYVVCISSRQPSRFHISRTTGQISMTELIPSINNQIPVFASGDHVPFRYTPNLQNFVGPIGMEGLLASGITAIGKALTMPDFDLDQQLCLFARDEVLTWLHQRGRPMTIDMQFRQHVAINIEGVVKKAEQMACKAERSQEPKDAEKPVQVMQTVTNLISMATNPNKLALMPDLFAPWF